MPTFKIGEMVKIVQNTVSHGFKIGDVVRIVSLENGGIGNCSDGNEMWCVRNDDVVKIEKKDDNKCNCCNSLIPDDCEKINSVDGIICESCHDNEYFYCESCDEVHHNDDLICPEDECFCSISCANNKGWYKCDDCSEWDDDNDGYQNSNGNDICSRCSENYYSCDNCGEIICTDDSRYDERSGNTYCDDCFEGEEKDSVIKSYAYKPREYLMKKMAWENTTYLGIELELEAGRGNASELASKVMGWLTAKGLDKLVYIKEDGSLQNGFEVVFMPMTLQYMHKKFPMKAFLAFMQTLKLTSHQVGTCGLHVHISRTELSERNIYAGKIFFFKCASYLKKLSARTGKRSDGLEDLFHYCQFDKTMPSSWDAQYFGKYSAFNSCASSSTVELRLFRGTLVYERFLASLQFSDAFGEYIKTLSVAGLKHATSEVIWGAFIAWAKRSNKYGQFIKYVIKKGIL